MSLNNVKLRVCLPIIVGSVCLAALPATAGTITYTGQTADLGAMGYGHIPPVLSVQAQGAQDTEWGLVRWDGSADVLEGNATKPGSETMLVSDLLAEGLTKYMFGIVLNINEDTARDVIVQSFFLDVYAPSGGAPIFSVPFVGGPLPLSTVGQGQGQAGYLFMVSLNDQEWNDYFAGATSNRVGMTVPQGEPILNVSDGGESFTVAPVPEPVSLLLAAMGGFGLIRRPRR